MSIHASLDSIIATKHPSLLLVDENEALFSEMVWYQEKHRCE